MSKKSIMTLILILFVGCCIVTAAQFAPNSQSQPGSVTMQTEYDTYAPGTTKIVCYWTLVNAEHFGYTRDDVWNLEQYNGESWELIDPENTIDEPRAFKFMTYYSSIFDPGKKIVDVYSSRRITCDINQFTDYLNEGEYRIVAYYMPRGEEQAIYAPFTVSHNAPTFRPGVPPPEYTTIVIADWFQILLLALPFSLISIGLVLIILIRRKRDLCFDRKPVFALGLALFVLCVGLLQYWSFVLILSTSLFCLFELILSLIFLIKQSYRKKRYITYAIALSALSLAFNMVSFITILRI